MSKQTIVTINGRSYDAVTGLPVETAKPNASRQAPAPGTHVGASSATVHQTTQRSRTLNRRAAKKTTTAPAATRPTGGKRTMDVARSGRINHFATHPSPTAKAEPGATVDLPPIPHPAVKKATEKRTPAAAKPLSSKEVKKAAIAEALARPATSKVTKSAKPSFARRHKVLLIISGSIVILIIIAGILYISLPSLSVTVAGNLAGVGASYPGKVPNGYRLSSPATYSDGKVTLDFQASAGNAQFSLVEAKSSWDSSAVLANIVTKKAGSNYLTTEDSGLTIYTYGSNAAWVDGGLLYTISGNAPLSTDQISQLAASL